MKLFQVPINHPYIQNLTSFDLNFIEWASAMDNPEFMQKMQNTFYDEEFDDFWENYDEEKYADDITGETYDEFEDGIPSKITHFADQKGDIESSTEDKSRSTLNTQKTDENVLPDDDFEELPDISGDNITDWEDVDDEQ
jgi:hypothetical protein